jgi:hypothetical protein
MYILYILVYITHYVYIQGVLDSWKFGTSTMCSARSQIFFLDKISETCQKFS